MCSCKVCGKLKVRQDGGKRSGCSGVYKVDGAGRRWNGLTCPDCRVEYTKPANARDADLGPSEPLYAPKLRNCRTCKVPNPNYYDCNGCMSVKAQHGCYDTVSLVVDEPMLGRVNTKAGWRY